MMFKVILTLTISVQLPVNAQSMQTRAKNSKFLQNFKILPMNNAFLETARSGRKSHLSKSEKRQEARKEARQQERRPNNEISYETDQDEKVSSTTLAITTIEPVSTEANNNEIQEVEKYYRSRNDNFDYNLDINSEEEAMTRRFTDRDMPVVEKYYLEKPIKGRQQQREKWRSSQRLGPDMAMRFFGMQVGCLILDP